MPKKLYCVVDCETATLPCANEISHGDPERKKRIAIARPLIYDIGWTITDRQGNISSQKQFLVAEIFSVPQIFNTAYYADKRPIYLEKIHNKEITIRPWNEIAEIMIEDFSQVTAIGAFNSMFDFKKAIPFTELYINKLYSPDYYNWEKMQYSLCEKIAEKNARKDKENEFNPNEFIFRGINYPLFDLWGLATKHLLNTPTYKKACIAHDLFTATGLFFKTSAESTYKYLCDKYDFIEAHTALEDAIIETFILSKIAQRHAIDCGISYFPFRDLGETVQFCQRRKNPDLTECEKVYDTITNYIEEKDPSPYITTLINKINELATYARKVEWMIREA